MSLVDKFEMLEPFTKDDLRTFLGRERDSRRPVLIHLVPRNGGLGSECGLAQILLSHIAAGKGGPILDAGESRDPSCYYVVTEMPADAGIRQSWLDRYQKAQGIAYQSSPQPDPLHQASPVPVSESSAAAPRLSASSGGAANGRNTSAVQNSVNTNSTATEMSNVSGENKPISMPASTGTSSEPGEFTGLWCGPRLGREALGTQSQSSSINPIEVPCPEVDRPIEGHSLAPQVDEERIPDSPQSVQSEDSGSFTRMFQSPFAEPKSNEHPGAYTRLFSAPETALRGSDDSQAVKSSPSIREHSPLLEDSVTPAREESGAFSMLLKSPACPPESSAPPHPTAPNLSSKPRTAHPIDSGGAGATQLFAVRKPPATVEPTPASGPSEFTRVVAAPPASGVKLQSVDSLAEGAKGNRQLPPVQVSATAPTLNLPQSAPLPSPLRPPPRNSPFAMSSPSFPGQVAPVAPSGGSAWPGQANSPAQQQVTHTPVPAEKIPRNFLYLVLSLNLLFGIAVLLIVYFVVKH